MVDIEMLNLLRKSEYVSFELVRTLSFFILLGQLLIKHLPINRALVHIARVLIDMDKRKKGVASDSTPK
jgi:hypothetical protein